jgi:hypothetical protein
MLVVIKKLYYDVRPTEYQDLHFLFVHGWATIILVNGFNVNDQKMDSEKTCSHYL